MVEVEVEVEVGVVVAVVVAVVVGVEVGVVVGVVVAVVVEVGVEVGVGVVVMNTAEAFKKITETCLTSIRFGGVFSVFYSAEEGLEVTHLTHKRAETLRQDLQNKFGPTRKGLVGIYDRHLDADWLQEDVDFVIQTHKHKDIT